MWHTPGMNIRTRTGYALLSAEVVFGGLLPVLGKLSGPYLQPIFIAGGSTLIASIFFAVILTIRKTWSDVLNRDAFRYLLGTTLLIVVGYYGCMFLSLQMTSATNVSILSRFEILTTIFLLGIFSRHEHVGAGQIVGAMLILAGVILVLFAEVTTPNMGDLIMIVGTFLTPYGNLFQQRARRIISGEAVYFFRSTVGGATLLLIAFVVESTPAMEDVRSALPYLFLSGFLVFGLGKMLFVEALHRLRITVIIPLSSMGVLVTILSAHWFLGEPIAMHQIIALAPLFIGIWLVTKKGNKDLPENMD
jgi:drug/metabolite transporter (DMT)-like permease